MRRRSRVCSSDRSRSGDIPGTADAGLVSVSDTPPKLGRSAGDTPYGEDDTAAATSATTSSRRGNEVLHQAAIVLRNIQLSTIPTNVLVTRSQERSGGWDRWMNLNLNRRKILYAEAQKRHKMGAEREWAEVSFGELPSLRTHRYVNARGQREASKSNQQSMHDWQSARRSSWLP